MIETPAICLVQDTREKRGYRELFSAYCVIDTLEVGDYSVAGLTDRVAIERKSLQDLISSFTTGRKRFDTEFRKARSLEYFAVVVEARLSDVIRGDYERSKANPSAIFESIMSWSCKYGTPFFLAESRSLAGKTTESLLQKYVRQFHQAVQEMERAARRYPKAG